MPDPLSEPQCPHCGSATVKWIESDTLDGLRDHAETVKCGECEEVYSIEYEVTAVAYYDEERDEWETVPVSTDTPAFSD